MTSLNVAATFTDQYVFPFGGVVFEFGNGPTTFSQRRLLRFDRRWCECNQQRSTKQQEEEQGRPIRPTRLAHFTPPAVGWQDERPVFEQELVARRAAASDGTMKICAGIGTLLLSQSNT
jgi:hypothetical protein